MMDSNYACDCGREMSYSATKHNGCPNCGNVPRHSAD
jgi:DNA-directed RNA polymerase subunit RPC12/RpoP